MVKPHKDIPGLIEVDFVGHIDVKKMSKLLAETLEKTAGYADKAIPVKVLVNSAKLKSFVTPMKAMLIRGIRDLEVSKIALYGAPPKYPELREEIAEATGLSGRIKHCATREEALEWLGRD
jgi:hypothetical protein